MLIPVLLHPFPRGCRDLYEHDGQVGFDRFALVVEHRPPRPQVGFGHPEALLDVPQIVVASDVPSPQDALTNRGWSLDGLDEVYPGRSCAGMVTSQTVRPLDAAYACHCWHGDRGWRDGQRKTNPYWSPADGRWPSFSGSGGLEHGSSLRRHGTGTSAIHAGGMAIPGRHADRGEVAVQFAAASELVDFNKSDFAGSYVDETSTLVVVTTSDRGQQMAAERFPKDSGVRIEHGNLSLARASTLGHELYRGFPTTGAKIWQWAVDPAASALKLGVNKPLDGEDRSIIDNFAQANAVLINVYIDETAQRGQRDDRLEDASPFAGGFRYARADGTTSSATVIGRCSGGFGYENDSGTADYILTAGHCWDRGGAYDRMWNTYGGSCPSNCGKKNYIGIQTYSTWNNGEGTVNTGNDAGNHGDMALVNVSTAGKAAGTQIWWGGVTTTDKIPVTARKVPTVGDDICINGITSGSDCGLTIVETNINHVYDDGDEVINGDYANSTSNADCSQSGDSGGSIIINHSGAETQATGVGIISGHIDYGNIGCAQVFTGIEEAMQAWDGKLKFN